MNNLLSPARLSGLRTLRQPNSTENPALGLVVHVVRCNESERVAGIVKQVHTLCGRTHGDKNDGWLLCPEEAVTCPKCRKKMP